MPSFCPLDQKGQGETGGVQQEVYQDGQKSRETSYKKRLRDSGLFILMKKKLKGGLAKTYS